MEKGKPDMNAGFTQPSVLVSLPIRFIEALLATYAEMDQVLTDALKFSISEDIADDCKVESRVDASLLPEGSYMADFLGVSIAAHTLPLLFGQIIDLMAGVAPEALDALASIKARSRRFIALESAAIHPESPHLPVMQTTTGWWISKNIGHADLERAMRALCSVSGLIYGSDLKFQ